MCLGVPGLVVSVDRSEIDFPVAVVEFAGVRRNVSIACVPEVEPGIYVLVHAGIALQVIDEKEAQLVFSYLDQMQEDDNWNIPSETKANES